MYRKMKRIVSAVVTVILLFSFLTIPASAEELNAANFNSRRYADDYPDLKAVYGYDHYALWHHYLTHGEAERRIVFRTDGGTPSFADPALSAETFDSRRYADDYPDLKAAFGYDHARLWQHYVTFGRTERRRVYALTGAAASGMPLRATFEHQFAAQMLSLVNQERSRAGLHPLSLSDGATAAARARGEDFVRFYEAGAILTNVPHIRPDGTSFTSAYAVRSATKYGENVMLAYWLSDDDAASFSARAHSAFAASSAHYMQMINANYSYAGFYPVYIREYGAASLYVVIQEFHN